MKISHNGVVYLQGFDLAFILNFCSSIPADFLLECLGPEQKPLVVNHDNQYSFTAFKNPATVQWIDSKPWFIDYEHYVGLEEETKDAINALVDDIARQHQELQDYRIRNEATKEIKRQMQFDLDCAFHQLDSLKIMYLHNRHKINFDLPPAFRGDPVTIQRPMSLFQRFFNYLRGAH